MWSLLSCPSTPPQRLVPQRAAFLPTSPADPEPPSESTSLCFSALQHSQTCEPFFFTASYEEASPNRSLEPGKSRLQGLATLWTTFVRASLRASFSSRRSWALPFRAFLPWVNREKVSLRSSALALPSQTFQPGSGASAIFSPPMSRPPYPLPNSLRRGGGFCSLGLFSLSGFPTGSPRRTSLSFFAPFRSSTHRTLQPDVSGTLRFFSIRPGYLPP